MCFTSLVMEQYRPYIPEPQRWPWPAPAPALPVDELRELIDSFKAALEAAKTFDRVTGQPDCVDPEKALLEERVAALEKKLDEIAQAAS